MFILFRTLLLIIPVLISVSPSFSADSFQGRILKVIDGDTLRVKRTADSTPVTIRLYGIDCPEKTQKYGSDARQLTLDLTSNKTVTIKSHGLGRYERTIGEVILSNGQNLNHELVRSGMCWWYRRYTPNDETLSRLEKESREGKRGLWENPNPIPPWEWRKRRK